VTTELTPGNALQTPLELTLDRSLRRRAQTGGEGPLSNHVSLTDHVYRVLLEMVVRRELAPGQKLSLVGLSEFLGISRTPVKEAIDRLETEGLVEISPRRGTFVRPISRSDIEEIFELRLLVEPYAARIGAPRMSDNQAARAQAIVLALGDCIEHGHLREDQIASFAALDREFHELIVESAGNSRLTTVYRSLNVVIQIMRFSTITGLLSRRDIDTGHREHQAIASALQARDGDRAAMELERHIRTAQTEILNLLDASGPDPFL
jgi:DNA-binding GntR family transcriptional regulator